MLIMGSEMMMMMIVMRMMNPPVPLLFISAHHLGVNLMCRSEPARRWLAASKWSIMKCSLSLFMGRLVIERRALCETGWQIADCISYFFVFLQRKASIMISGTFRNPPKKDIHYLYLVRFLSRLKQQLRTDKISLRQTWSYETCWS